MPIAQPLTHQFIGEAELLFLKDPDMDIETFYYKGRNDKEHKFFFSFKSELLTKKEVVFDAINTVDSDDCTCFSIAQSFCHL